MKSRRVYLFGIFLCIPTLLISTKPSQFFFEPAPNGVLNPPTLATMNFIDVLLIVPLIYAGWKGFKHGFVIELFTLLAFFVGIYAGINFSDYAAEKLTNEFDIEKIYLAPTAFALTFLVVGALVYFAGKAVEQLVKVVAMSPLNKAAGLGFGLLKMAYILSVVLVIVESYDEKKQWFKDETKSASLLYKPVKNLGYYTLPGMQESQIFLENAFKEEKEKTNLTVKQILAAKRVADSLGIEANDANTLYQIHQEHVAK